ncbi:hypothetical protein EGW08_023416 [Elysia chlorotica]|uniref:Uncharacterized protein n=1 Tax=Elysia chlorotica TaxID=188477 RepID=A0A433SIP1_ELYCH|nr:hypothetical protein EGW08_023416 [Elysia chlorotica]
MIVTATIFTVLILSGLSYLFGRPKKDKEVEINEEENKEVEDTPKQKRLEINEISTQTAASITTKDISKEIAPTEPATKIEVSLPPESEPSRRPSAGDIKQGKTPAENISKTNNLKTEEICQSLTNVGKKTPNLSRNPSNLAQKVKSVEKKGHTVQEVSLQRHTSRESSPRRGKAKKSDSSCKCRASSPVSGKLRNLSYGYIFANQPPCDPFCPRLY